MANSGKSKKDQYKPRAEEGPGAEAPADLPPEAPPEKMEAEDLVFERELEPEVEPPGAVGHAPLEPQARAEPIDAGEPPRSFEPEAEAGFGEELGPMSPDEKIPIKRGAVAPLLRAVGDIGAMQTGWAGWYFADDDINDFTSLLQQAGFQASAKQQVLACIAGMIGSRAVGYRMWVSQGKPEEQHIRNAARPGPKPRPAPEAAPVA